MFKYYCKTKKLVALMAGGQTLGVGGRPAALRRTDRLAEHESLKNCTERLGDDAPCIGA